MANQRSMLPKFRPATLGGSERPKIRPVKPSAPPQPPRRHSSGIRNPELEPQPPTQNYGEPPTMAAARARIHEIARELPAENRFASDRHNYNDETQGRIEPIDFAAAHAAYDRQFGAADAYDRLPALGHHEHFDAGYPQQDPMTELRPAYDEALHRHENPYREEPYHREEPYRDEPYRSDRPLPEDDSSGEYARRERRPSPPPPATYSAASNSYDPAAYEANYPKHGSGARREEPSYKSQAPKSDYGDRHRSDEGRSFRRDDFPREASSYRDDRREDRRDERREDNRSFRREEPRREERREASSYQPARADETRAEGSSAKHDAKRSHESSWSKNEPSIPGPARVPSEMRVPENFVVGVQPIRTPSMGAAFPPPQAVITPAYGPAPVMTAAASPAAMGMPQITMPPMMAPMAPMTPMMAGMNGGSVMNQMHVRAHTSARPPGHIPQPTEVEEAQQGSKIGRFAWFVFGAAFGIFFAFFATGFGFGKKEEPVSNFPPAPTQLPAPVQTQTAPPAPAPPPVVQQQPAMMQQPMMQQPAMMQQPPQQLAPVAPVPAPPPGVMVAPNQNVGPIVPAQQPTQAQRPAPQAQNQGTVVVRGGGRPAAPPRRSGGGGRAAAAAASSDDDAPAPKKSSSGGGEPNVADLLGQGLGN